MVTPAPQPRQMPPVLLQVIPEGQPAQAAPPVPHWVLLSLAKGTQVVPEQHPFGHEVASHTHPVPLQRWPVPQVAHDTPDFPHADTVSVVMQVVPLQQPVAHDVASQTHAPAALHS
jgi:hypothetical protein